MTIQTLPFSFTVCKVRDATCVDATKPFTFAAVTDAEVSLVCQTAFAPTETVAREDGWRAFRVKGSMEFGLVGVLARLTGVLAARSIPVFAVSTFDTDYVLVKAERFDDAVLALRGEGIEAEAWR